MTDADADFSPLIRNADDLDELLKPAHKFGADWIEAGFDLEMGALLLEFHAAWLRAGVSPPSMNLMGRQVVDLDGIPREDAHKAGDEVRTKLAECLGAVGRKPTRRALTEFISKSKSQVAAQKDALLAASAAMTSEKFEELVQALAPIVEAIKGRMRDLGAKKSGVADAQQPLP